MDRQLPTFPDQNLGSKSVQKRKMEPISGIKERQQKVKVVKANKLTKEQHSGSIGDYKHETVQQVRDESVEHLIQEAKYAYLQGKLMEMGILTHSHIEEQHRHRQFKQRSEAYRLQLSSDMHAVHINEALREKGLMGTSQIESRQQVKLRDEINEQNNMNNAHLKESFEEKGLLDSWLRQSAIPPTASNKTEGCSSGENGDDFTSTSMMKIINDINQLSTHLEESNTQDINWNQFHSNLLKVHQYYANNIEGKVPQVEQQATLKSNNLGCKSTELENATLVDGLTQVGIDIDDAIGPLNSLMIRSDDIENSPYTSDSLDVKKEQFYTKYYQSLLNREKAYKDMIELQILRKDIEEKLTKLESDLKEWRNSLM